MEWAPRQGSASEDCQSLARTRPSAVLMLEAGAVASPSAGSGNQHCRIKVASAGFLTGQGQEGQDIYMLHHVALLCHFQGTGHYGSDVNLLRFSCHLENTQWLCLKITRPKSHAMPKNHHCSLFPKKLPFYCREYISRHAVNP